LHQDRRSGHEGAGPADLVCVPPVFDVHVRVVGRAIAQLPTRGADENAMMIAGSACWPWHRTCR
jgi:hypothetical protein